eukprot:scaffold1167_cov418-Prasinococcus_capsulatus_cf.AAC.9
MVTDLDVAEMGNSSAKQVAYLDSRWNKLLSYAFVYAHYFRLMILPTDLCHAHSQANIRLLRQPWTSNVVPIGWSAAALFLVCWLGMGFYPCNLRVDDASAGKEMTRRGRIAVAMTFILFGFLPASNLLAPVGFHLAERVLYIPSIGWCILVGTGIQHWHAAAANKGNIALQRMWMASLCALVATQSVQSLLRARDWQDAASLHTSGLLSNPGNPDIWCNLATSIKDHNPARAVSLYEHALELDPLHARSWASMAVAIEKAGGEGSGKRAVEVHYQALAAAEECTDHLGCLGASGQFETLYNLGNSLLRMGSIEDAIQQYRQAIGLGNNAPTQRLKQLALVVTRSLAQAWNNMGVAYKKLKEYEKAMDAYHSALQVLPTHANTHANIGNLLLERDGGYTDDAIRAYQKALEIDPTHHNAATQLANSRVSRTGT